MRIVFMALLASFTALAADGFSGKWNSDQNGNGGGIRATFRPEPKVTFTLSGQDFACTVVSSKAEGESIEIAYDFIMQGYKLRSTLKGTVKEGRVEGKYNTRVADEGTPVDSGTFEGTTQ